ncbi:hypothetical protein, partial [Williamsia sp. 1135]|uniref:hypothetical protein n=1 Tax=Williamsia sp. 1135 TaxID=1889262 RepID=UPI0032048FBC
MVQYGDDGLLQHGSLRAYVRSEKISHRGMFVEQPLVEANGEIRIACPDQCQAVFQEIFVHQGWLGLLMTGMLMLMGMRSS